MSRSDLLGTIMREHRDSLVSYAEKMLGDHGLAEDIVQETIIRAWRNIDRLLGTEVLDGVSLTASPGWGTGNRPT
ncbi:RNA polymerase sigma factor [Streptomyces sp. NPDC052016]|uniref:RNA polymerase sigma factor n=1 Tax=unclassified Streptomyces TaxID=2593676 RepID=UPI00341F0A95